VNLFGQDMIFVSNLELIHKIFGDRERFQNEPGFRNSLSYSLPGESSMFGSEGETWKARHRILEPMQKLNFLRFHTKTMSRTMSKMVGLVGDLARSRKVPTVDFFTILQRATIEVIGHAIFGVDLGVLPDDLKDLSELEQEPLLAKTFAIVLDAITARINLPSVLWPLQYYLSGERKAALEMQALFKRLLEEKKVQLAGSGDDEKAGVEGTTLLELILRFKRDNPEEGERVYPETEIFQDCLSLFGAGYDTTTITTSFLLYHLAEHQEVQNAVYEEIMGIVREENDTEDEGSISYAQTEKLEYLGRVIKESQRVVPAVPSLLRYTTTDTEVLGVKIPKGVRASVITSHSRPPNIIFIFVSLQASVFMNLQALYNSEKLFPESGTFNPDRWSSTEPGEKPAFFFGHGTRRCFGQKLALLQIKVFIFHLLQGHRVELHPGQKLETEFIFSTNPKGKKMPLLLIPREKS